MQIPLARVYRMFLILDDSCLCSLQRIFLVFFVMHCPDSLDIYATEILARKHACAGLPGGACNGARHTSKPPALVQCAFWSWLKGKPSPCWSTSILTHAQSTKRANSAKVTTPFWGSGVWRGLETYPEVPFDPKI